MTVATTIDGIEVEVDRDDEFQWSDCYLYLKTSDDIFSGTLQFVDTHGCLINDKTGRTLVIPARTLKKIREFAEDNGY